MPQRSGIISSQDLSEQRNPMGVVCFDENVKEEVNAYLTTQ